MRQSHLVAANITICFVVLTQPLFAQDFLPGWQLQGPSPTHMNIQSVDFVDPDNGWVVADNAAINGGIWRTQNGGQSWTKMLQGAFNKFDDLQMLDLQNGWAAGDSIYSTSDGWITWSQSPIPSSPSGEPSAVSATKIQFVDLTHGWMSTRPAAGISWLYRTTNGGTTWEYARTVALDSWRFLDEQIGWAADENQSLIRTVDGGVTWSSINDPPGSILETTVAEVFSVDEAVVVTFADFIFTTHHTYDGGQTWVSSNVETNAPRFPVFLDNEIGWGPIPFGGIARTNDGGVTWNTQLDVTRINETVEHLDIVDPSTVYVGGMYGYMLKTSDAGNQWNELSNGSGRDLIRVAFADDGLHGWATGDNTILHTKDGGRTWKHQFFPVQSGFPFSLGSPGDIYVFTTEHVYIRTGTSSIIETLDGGETWIELDPFPAQWPPGVVYFADPLRGWKSNGPLFSKTTDGGQTWTSNPTGVNVNPQDAIFDVFFVDDLNGWFVGRFNISYRTQDGGLTWQQTPDNPSTASSVFRRIRFTDPDNGWMVGNNGLILRTTDNGDSWTEQTLPNTFGEHYQDLVMISPDEAYICTQDDDGTSDGAFLRRTTDGGVSWPYEYVGPPVNDFLYGVTVGIEVVGEKVWTVGFNGMILHNGEFLLGDTNGDGTVSLLDVQPFVELLTNGGFLPEADINQDGVLNLLDVAPFVEILQSP